MRSSVIKRSVVVSGRKTSVSLEDAFWKALKEIAVARDLTLSDLVGSIDAGRQQANLSSAIRLFILNFYKIELSVRTAVEEMPLDPTVARPVLSA
jgi:predicted DNA-binding ribbon-helix-helix protein